MSDIAVSISIRSNIASDKDIAKVAKVHQLRKTKLMPLCSKMHKLG